MARRGTAASINLVELEELTALQCTDEEIAGWFGVSTRTVERRRKSRVFAETMERGRAKGRISMRRAQLRMLENGNATMGVWLGKQYLGQTDEFDINANGPMVVMVGYSGPNLTPPTGPAQIAGASDVAQQDDQERTIDIAPDE
jgi:hypothetical protein